MKTKIEQPEPRYEFPPLAKPNPQHYAKILEESASYYVQHNKGGNGWIIIKDAGDEYVFMSPLTKTDMRVVQAWSGMLSVEMIAGPDSTLANPTFIKREIPSDLLLEVNRIRNDLRTGALVIDGSRMVSSKSKAA